MVIRGRTRGNGKQLANYLLTKGENERIQVLDTGGWEDKSETALRQSLLSMSLTSELTKSDKGLYHAQINPAYGEDERMTADDWAKAAGILAKELGLEEQRRVMVLHTKNGRTHAHIVWERYDYQKGKMISDSFSRLAQDRARHELERVFEHKRTPERNANRPDMKKELTNLWDKHPDGKAFIKAAKEQGYIIAEGIQRRPFMVVDRNGRSFDLVRQLDGVKTRDVREKLRGQKLIFEKDAIYQIRKEQEQNRVQEKQQGFEHTARTFADNRDHMFDDHDRQFDQPKQEKMQDFMQEKDELSKNEQQKQQEKNRQAAKDFAESRNNILSKEQERERQRQEFLERRKREEQERQQQKGRGFERD